MQGADCEMQGIRKIGRVLAIVALALAGAILLSDGLAGNPDTTQILLGIVAWLGAFGLLATWFCPTLRGDGASAPRLGI